MKRWSPVVCLVTLIIGCAAHAPLGLVVLMCILAVLLDILSVVSNYDKK